MLQFTAKQVNMYIVICIIMSIFYMIIYYLKGTRKNFEGYFQALQSCIVYCVLQFFVIFGIFITKQVIIQEMYIGLIIPIIWGLIIYSIIKTCLKRDFNINFQILKINAQIFEKIIRITILSMFIVALGFMSAVMLFIAVHEIINEPIRAIIVFFAAIMCLGFVIIILNDLLINYTQIRLKINIKKLVLFMSTLIILAFILACFL